MIKNETMLYLSFIIGVVSVLTGILLFITHIDKTIGTFLIKAGLIYEAVAVARFFMMKKLNKKGSF